MKKRYVTKKEVLTADRLRELVRYDADTGNFFWREYRRGMSPGGAAGTISTAGYWQMFVCGKTYPAHRLAWLYVNGSWPENQIDHIDGNKTNNKFSNLRAATQTENSRNTTRVRVTEYVKKSGRSYKAMIFAEGENKTLGIFPSYGAAKDAYLRATERYFGEFSAARRLVEMPAFHF